MTVKFQTGGFLGMLVLVFITLKLTHFIDWSWTLVLAPFWLPLVIVFSLLIVAFIGYLLIELWK